MREGNENKNLYRIRLKGAGVATQAREQLNKRQSCFCRGILEGNPKQKCCLG